MKRFVCSVLLALGVATPAFAQVLNGVLTAYTVLYAGPDPGYPTIAQLPAGTSVAVQGCTQGWGWCDVITLGMRGWVPGTFVQYYYQSQPVIIADYGAQIGIPIVAFAIGSYWGNYYRDRTFYRNRDYWYSRPYPTRPPPRPPGYRPGYRPPGAIAYPPGPAYRPPLSQAPRPPNPGARPPPNATRPPNQGNRPPPYPGQHPPVGSRPPPNQGNRPPPNPGQHPPAGNRPPPNQGNRPPGDNHGPRPQPRPTPSNSGGNGQ